MRLRSHLALTLTAALAPSAAAADLLDVSPGGPISSIADAISVAEDGDVIRVAPGSYPGFRILDRSLSVVALSPGTVDITSTVLIANIHGERGVALHGLRIAGLNGPAVDAANSTAPIILTGCDLHGYPNATPSSNPTPEETHAGLRAVGLDDLRTVGCDILGGGMASSSTAFYSWVDDGAPGIELAHTMATLDDTSARGGSTFDYTTKAGGHGLLLTASIVEASGCLMEGAMGADLWSGHYCGNHNPRAGDGGHGIHATLGSVIATRGCTLQPGYAAGSPCAEQAGTDGLGISDPAALLSLPGPARRFEWEPLARGGSILAFEVSGRTGDHVYIRTSDARRRGSLPGAGGYLATGSPLLRPASGLLGVIPGGGSVTMRLKLPQIGASQMRWLEADLLIIAQNSVRIQGPKAPIYLLGSGL